MASSNSPGNNSGAAVSLARMADDIKPKELSKDLVKTLLIKNDKAIKLSGCLQLLSISPDSSQIEVSDGYSKTFVVLLRNIRPVLEKHKIGPFDVVYITLVLHKAEKVIIVAVEISKIYGSVNCLIGAPLEFEKYFQEDYINRRGDNAIPKFCWQIHEIKKAQVGAFHREGIGHKEFDDNDAAQHAIITIKAIKKNGGLVNLRVRVTKKTPKKDYSSKTVQKGKLFSCIFRDNTGEIQATFFQDATEKYFDMIQDEDMYIFKGCEVRNRGSYNPTDNPLELYIPAKCVIEPTLEDPRISRTVFEFVRINELPTRPPKSNCDMVGVVTSVTAPDMVARRTGDPLLKQAVKLKDDSGFEADINLWGEIPNSNLLKVGVTVCILDLSVSDFKDRMLNSKTSTRLITYLPEHPRVAAVRDWKKKSYEIKPGNPGGADERRGPIATYLVTVDQYRRAVNSLVAKGFEGKRFFSIRAFATTFSTNYFYEKCPNPQCYKKVSFDDRRPGVTICPACGPLHRPPIITFIGNLRITDHTGSIYVNYATEHIGLALYGMNVNELKEMQTKSQENFEMYVRSRLGLQYIFRLFFKKDIVEGEIKLKYHLASVFEETAPNKIRYTNLSLRATLKLILKTEEKKAELEALNEEFGDGDKDENSTDKLLTKLIAEYSDTPAPGSSDSQQQPPKVDNPFAENTTVSDPSALASEINLEHQAVHEESALIEMASTTLTVEAPASIRVEDLPERKPAVGLQSKDESKTESSGVSKIENEAPFIVNEPTVKMEPVSLERSLITVPGLANLRSSQDPAQSQPFSTAEPATSIMPSKTEPSANTVIPSEISPGESANAALEPLGGLAVSEGLVVKADEAPTPPDHHTPAEPRKPHHELPLGLKSPGSDSQHTRESDADADPN